MRGTDILFPRPRLNKIVPGDQDEMDLQLVCRGDPSPMRVKLMISKGCQHINDYKPRSGTVPLYEFGDLQTLLLREVDDMPLKDLEFRSPEGPLAKKRLGRFKEMLTAHSKIGKRKMREFRYNSYSQTYILVSSDGELMCLRAKNEYIDAYTHIDLQGHRRGLRLSFTV